MSERRRSLTRLIAVVALANAVFFALQYAAAGRPDIAAERTRAAFEAGDLTTNDWPYLDARLGANQYDDCLILEMVGAPSGSRLERAVSPPVYSPSTWPHLCATVQAVVTGALTTDGMEVGKYSRYWHGYNVVTAAALQITDLGTLRTALTVTVWLAIFVLALTTWRSGRFTRVAGVCIAHTAATVWAVPYYAPSIAHGVGDAALLFWLAGFVVLMRRRPTWLAGYAAAFGASVVFFEFLTGQLPIAAAWLIALTVASARDRDGEPVRPSVTAATAFGVGAVLTIAAKQALAVLTVDGDAIAAFGRKLAFYSQAPTAGVAIPSVLMPVRALWRSAHVLTYGHTWPGRLLIVGAVLAWSAGVLWALRVGPRRAAAPLAILAAAAIPAAWTLLLPSHTAMHGGFMVRILVVPISLAPLALWWCATALDAEAIDPGAPGDG